MATRNIDRFCEDNPTIILGHTKQKVEVLEYLRRNTPDALTELKALQEKEFSEKTTYKAAWNEATNIYNQRNNASFSSIYKSKHPAEYHIALIAYTLESPKFYFEFNAATRNLKTAKDFNSYPYKSFFKLLLLATSNVSGKPKAIPTGQKLYRGVSGKIDNAKVGNTVVFQHFVSTSRRSDIADFFGGDVLFVLENIQAEHMYTCLDDHSYYKDQEQEVLVCPYENYVIENIEEKNKKRYIHLKAEYLLDAKTYL